MLEILSIKDHRNREHDAVDYDILMRCKIINVLLFLRYRVSKKKVDELNRSLPPMLDNWRFYRIIHSKGTLIEFKWY